MSSIPILPEGADATAPAPAADSPDTVRTRTPTERTAREAARIAVVTLGCPKNLVDSETMLGLLGRAGYRTTGELEAADIAVVNTCSFIEPAREESIDAILEVAAQKTEGRLRALVVAGCLAQLHGADLVREIPEVDAVIGTGELGRIAGVVDTLLRGGPGGVHVGAPGAPVSDFASRVIATPPHHAYLKISEGCDHRCAFCIIPQLRGALRSRTVEENLEEASRLVGAGVRELNLVSQDTTGYGTDLPGGRGELRRLLAGLDALDGVAWIRLIYTHPALWDTELMDAVAELEHVVPYVDIPIQHMTDRMLKRMNRGLSARRQRWVLEELRRRVPSIAVRTTVLLGHPGEREEDVDELLAFIGDYRFERLGCFAYSREESTRAGEAEDQVSPEVAADRLARVEAEARRVALELHAARVGTSIEVMIDGPPEEGRTPARSTWDAPEIDGLVWIEGELGPPGALEQVWITGAGARDLTAMPALESGQET